jgi:hypothetical protein
MRAGKIKSKGFIFRKPIILGVSRLVSSGSFLAQGLHLALYLMLLTGISAIVTAEEVSCDVAPGELYRLEDGVLVIDWSPEVEFSSNFTKEGDNSSMAETGNYGLNDSLSALQMENVSSDSGSSFSSLSLAESGAASGAHLGWASWDPQADGKGRHGEYGRRVTDLVGVFSIEMKIKLGSNLSSSPDTTEWIPCP